MALHRYWRIHITESTSGSNMLISLYEVELRAIQGGLDLCSGGSAFASHADADAYKLFDDNISSYWVNGAPSEATWFRYDFGAGNAVDVAEVRLLPRYASQSPKTFSLQYSDDDLEWFVETSWANITDWIGGVEKLFSPPPPPAIMASAQIGQPFSLSLTVASAHAYLYGDLIRSGVTTPYALHLEAAQQHPWSMMLTRGSTHFFGHLLACQRLHSFSLQVSVEREQLWKRFLSCALLQTLHTQVDQDLLLPCSLRHRVEMGNSQGIVSTWSVWNSREQGFNLQLHNDVVGVRYSHWNLSIPPFIIHGALPTLHMDDLPLSLISAAITFKPEQPFWFAQLHLALDTDFAAMTLDSSFVLQIGGESYAFLVDGKRLDRSGSEKMERILYGVSPTARYDIPRSAVITKSWSAPVWARDVVESLLGAQVTWTLPEWRIQADRLAVKELSPMQIAQQIAEAAGGVVQTHPDGGLSVRPRFPYAVPEWSDTEPHHVFTDESDILEICEVRHARERLDRVIVRDGPVADQRTYFDMELDRRGDGPNRGRIHFSPGEAAYLSLIKGQDVTVSSVTASSGQLMAAMPTTWQQTEELSFVASNCATLTKPTTEIVAIFWLGKDLGFPSLQKDGVTLVTPMVGTSIARITYTVAATTYPFTAPPLLAGENNFPVLFAVTGQTSCPDMLEIVAQRGNASHPVLEVVSPLLSDYRALRARAQTELDRGEALQKVELAIVYRPGVEVGQLVVVQDGLYGRSFYAMIVGVRHEMSVDGWVSRLTLQR